MKRNVPTKCPSKPLFNNSLEPDRFELRGRQMLTVLESTITILL